MIVKRDVSDDRLLIWMWYIDVLGVQQTRNFQFLFGDVESIVQVGESILWIQSIVVDQIGPGKEN